MKKSRSGFIIPFLLWGLQVWGAPGSLSESVLKKPISDSLVQVLKHTTEDSARVRLLLEIISHLRKTDPDTALSLCTEAFHLSQSLSRSRDPEEKRKGLGGLAKTYQVLGILHQGKGNYVQALADDSMALQI